MYAYPTGFTHVPSVPHETVINEIGRAYKR